MKITAITADNRKFFENLLVDSVNELVNNGVELIEIGLVEGVTAIGAVAATFDDSEVKILSIYVTPKYRRMKGATMLLGALMDLTRDYALGYSIEYIAVGSEHEALDAFLDSACFGDIVRSVSSLYSIKLGSITGSKYFKESTDFGETFVSLSDEEFSRLKKYAVATNAYTPERGLGDTDVEMDLSIAYKEDDNFKGFIVLEKINESTLLISGMQNDADKMVPVSLMQRAFTECKKKYGENLTLFVEPVNDTIKGFVMMIPEAEDIARSKYKAVSLF